MIVGDDEKLPAIPTEQLKVRSHISPLPNLLIRL